MSTPTIHGDQWSPVHSMARIQCAAQVPYSGAGDTALAKGKYFAISKPLSVEITQVGTTGGIAVPVDAFKHGVTATLVASATTCVFTLPTIAALKAVGFKDGDSMSLHIKINFAATSAACTFTMVGDGSEADVYGPLGNAGTVINVANGRFSFVTHVHLESDLKMSAVTSN